MHRIRDNVVVTWDEYMFAMSMTSLSYHVGYLPLSNAAETAAVDAAVDRHFGSMLKMMTPEQTNPNAVYAGFENGDVVGMRLKCIQGQAGCSNAEASTLINLARHATTSGKKYEYNTVVTNGVVSRGTFLADTGLYDATKRPWYALGKSCGRRSGSRYGNTCITNTYNDSFTGRLCVSFVQPFYDASNTFKGSRNLSNHSLIVWCRSVVGRCAHHGYF